MSLTQLLTVLRARLGLILMTTAAMLAAGVTLTLIVPKQYQASASVIVESRQLLDALTASSALPTASERVDNIISTQTDIIGSPAVALKVVETLQLEKNPRAKELLAGAGLLALAREAVASTQEWVVGLLPGEAVERPAMSLKDWMANRLLRELRLKSNRDSRVIRISYASSDPEFAATVANAFVKAYLDTILQMRTRPAKQSSQWFDEQMKDLKRTLEEAEAKLAKFQQEKGIVASDERLDVETGRLGELSAQLAVAQSLSYESLARQRHLREFLSKGGGEPPAEVSTSPVVQQLRAGVAEREAKLSELSKRVGRNHPQFQAASSELEKLRGQLNDEMRAAAQSMVTSTGVAPQREGALRGALDQQRARVLKMKNDRNELAILEREVENAKRSYTAAAQRFTVTKMESEVDQPSGSVIDAAMVPTRAASPNPGLNLSIALALGLALGIGTALLREAADRCVRSEHDIVEILGTPVLAVLSRKPVAYQNVRALRAPTTYSLPGP